MITTQPTSRMEIGPDVLMEMQDAMSEYAPAHFSPHTVDLKFAAECFEQFYNEMATKQSMGEVEELLFLWTSRLQEAAAANIRDMHLSVREVVHKQSYKELLYDCAVLSTGESHVYTQDFKRGICGITWTTLPKSERTTPSCPACQDIASAATAV